MANKQAALRHPYSCSNTAEQIQYDRSSEHSEATYLAEIILRNLKSSRLRQHTVNQPFFPICVYTGADLRANPKELCGPPVV